MKVLLLAFGLVFLCSQAFGGDIEEAIEYCNNILCESRRGRQVRECKEFFGYLAMIASSYDYGSSSTSGYWPTGSSSPSYGDWATGSSSPSYGDWATGSTADKKKRDYESSSAAYNTGSSEAGYSESTYPSSSEADYSESTYPSSSEAGYSESTYPSSSEADYSESTYPSSTEDKKKREGSSALKKRRLSLLARKLRALA